MIVVQRLLEFIARRGEGSHFGDRAYFAIGQPSEPMDQRKKEFDDASAELAGSRKKPFAGHSG